MSRKWLSGFSLGLALSVSAAHAQVVPPSDTEQITESGGVYIYTLPTNMQTVVEGDDNKYYAINYYTWYDPKHGKDGQVPGISLGQWWDDSEVGKFFPWGNDEALAERLSVGYQAYAIANNLLDDDGNLSLNGYDNGGGFIFGDWSGTPSGTQRPGNSSTSNNGLLYEWNSTQYYTRGGNNNRIQAFGGCAVNPISTGESPTTGNGSNGLVKSADNPCIFENDQVIEDQYAPVFKGGTLLTTQDVEGEASNTGIDVPFWVGSEGGTINNNGINTIFTGAFKDIVLAAFSSPGELNFEGISVTTLAGTNTYTGATNIESGTLKVTGTLSDSTAVTVASGATYDVDSTDTIGSIAGEGSVDLASGVTLTAGGDNSSTLFSGVMSGAGGFTKAGTGTTTFSGANTYTGATNIDAGTLQITNVSGLGSADTGTRVENNAVLRISVSGQKSDPGTNSENDARITEKIALAGGELDLDGNYIDLRGGVVLQGDGVNSTIRVKDGSREVFARSGEVVGKGGLIKEGKGYLRLATPLKYEGRTIIEDGELRIAAVTSLPQSTSVSVNQGGTLRLMGEGNEIQSLSGDGSIILEYDNVVLTSGLSGDEDEFRGVISGAGGFTKVGSGVLTLSGVNTFSGDISIHSGAVKVGGSQAIPKGADMHLGKVKHATAGYSGVLDLNKNSVDVGTLHIVGGSILGDGKLNVSEKVESKEDYRHNTLRIKGSNTVLELQGGGRLDHQLELEGAISIEGGKLLIMNSRAEGDGSLEIAKGAQLQVSNNSGYRGYVGKWDLINNGTLLFQKAPSQDITGDISGAGNIIINGAYEQAGKIITFSGKNTYTGNTTVNGSTLLAGADGTFSNASELIANEGGVIDLGGLNQSVGKISIKGGELKNGFLSGGTVEVFGTGFIDGVGAVAEESESESESKSETDSEVEAIVISPGSASLIANGLKSGGYLTLTGDNHFKDLKLENGKVLLGSLNKGTSKSGSLVLDGGVTGSAYGDVLVLQGALTLNEEQAIDLGGGDDLFFIGAKGSLIAAPLVEAEAELVAEAEQEEIKKLKITIDGGAGDMDIFWDASGNYYALTESADGLFTESEDSQLAGNVKNFELVGVAGQGIAYFGTTPSFATVQAEASPPPGEYGLMLGSVGKDKSLIGGVDQKLTINSGYDSRTRDSLITKVGGIALGKGDATIVVPGGTLEAGIIYGGGGKSTIELGSAFTGEVKLGALSSVAKGRLDVGVLYGYDTINQLGGLWSYNGRMDETDLLAQGVVRVKADDSATLKSITARQRLQKINSPLGINGRSVIAVSGELTIGEGGIQEQGTARASLLVASRDGANAHVDLKGESNYSGPTIVARGGSLQAHTDNALSSVSKTLVGNKGSILIEGSQEIDRLLIRKEGEFIGGGDSKLTTKSIVNRGDISLNSLVIEDGMTRFIDRYVKLKSLKGEPAPIAERLRNIDAQGSLKNIGGSINLDGDLKFISSGDAGGHALLNLTTGSRGFLPPSEATLSANSIQFSDKNDVLINSGSVETTGALGIDFGLGNDLVLAKGTFNIESGSKIDGGEPLDTSNWKPGNRSITGLNIFKAYENPGVVESDLVNWAAIKLGSDQDWLFPQGGECRVTGEGNIYSKDTLCVGLTGQKQDQFVQIDSGARLDAGVIALGRGSSNTIEVRNGELHAILIEGSPGQTKGATNDRLFLGDGSGGSGELIVGAITGFDSMEQRGGTWSYAVNGVDDPQVKERLISSGRRTAEELDEMGSFPAFTGYGIAKIAPVEITGRNKKQRTVQRAAFARIEGTNSKTLLQVQNIDSELEVSEGIHGNASLTTSGNTLLNGESSYTGATTIQSGGELKAGNALALSDSSEITIEPGGVLDLDGFANRILGLSGGRRAVSDPGIVKLGTNCSEDGVCDQELSGGILFVDKGDFNGVIEDVPGSTGALVKAGGPDDVLTLGGSNQYLATTLIQGGVLKAGADQSLSPNSTHRVIAGELDLRGFQQVLPQLDVAGGIVRVESGNPLNVTGDINFDDGRIVAYLDNGTKDDGANAPINASTFKYQPAATLRDADHGIYAVVNPDGRTDEDDLNGTWRIIEGDVPNSAELAKKTHLIFPVQPGQDVDLDADELINVDGQFYYVARFDGLNSPLDAAALKDIVLEEGSLNIVVSDKTSDEIIDDSKLPVDELDGCDLTEQLCESLDDDQTQDILDGIIGDDDQEGLEDELPVLHWGQLATLLGSGLAPRNVDAAGRGVALHNNLLVDAAFDRQPLRQFEALLADGDATDAGDVSFVDLQDDELDLAKRDGVSAWVKGFGGNSRADDSSILYNDYDLTAYGTSFGVDVALSETFQIGAYGNYGDLNVNQRSGETGGGSWNPEGWGGGLTAQYSTRNFYLQGLLGASEFSGEQSRNILDVADGLGGNTAKGDKTVTSYLGALRVGAPFKSGGVLLEPQGQVVWSQNDEHGFSENHGTEKNLRLKYKNRTTNFVETQLGLKLSVPIRTGDRALLVPSLRAAWVADWDMGHEAQEIGYKFTKKTVDFDSDLESQNGALIEAGLDYTIQNHNSTAWKIYGRGGVELWDSDRGATWRASGGVTFQF